MGKRYSRTGDRDDATADCRIWIGSDVVGDTAIAAAACCTLDRDPRAVARCRPGAVSRGLNINGELAAGRSKVLTIGIQRVVALRRRPRRLFGGDQPPASVDILFRRTGGIHALWRRS